MVSDFNSSLRRNYPIPDDFVLLARQRRPDAVSLLLGYLWKGYDRLCQADEFLAQLGDSQLEDGITYALYCRVQDVLKESDPFLPFSISHQPIEIEGAKGKGRPPQCDLSFRMDGGNPRSQFSIEAKVIQTEGAVSQYIGEVTSNFLTGRYSRYSTEGVMLGYLLSGREANVFDAIGVSLGCKLEKHNSFCNRQHRYSRHLRELGGEFEGATKFCCHHLLLYFGETQA